MPMTRAEGLCACRNLIEAVESLDEILPSDFSSGIHDKATSMAKYIEGTPQYPTITEKMDSAIRNMWNSVQKWNRRGLANAEMLYGLADVIEGLSQPTAAEPDEEAAGMATEVSRSRPTEGSETADFAATAASMLGGLTAEDERRLAEMSAASRTSARVMRAANPPRPAPAPVVGTVVPASAPALPDYAQLEVKIGALMAQFFETAAKARENLIATARGRFHQKGINVVPIEKIKHGDLTPVLRLTTSERTRQCLEAAFIAGQISGAKDVVEGLEDLLRKGKG
jgi:hypothetical protein